MEAKKALKEEQQRFVVSQQSVIAMNQAFAARVREMDSLMQARARGQPPTPSQVQSSHSGQSISTLNVESKDSSAVPKIIPSSSPKLPIRSKGSKALAHKTNTGADIAPSRSSKSRKKGSEKVKIIRKSVSPVRKVSSIKKRSKSSSKASSSNVKSSLTRHRSRTGKSLVSSSQTNRMSSTTSISPVKQSETNLNKEENNTVDTINVQSPTISTLNSPAFGSSQHQSDSQINLQSATYSGDVDNHSHMVEQETVLTSGFEQSIISSDSDSSLRDVPLLPSGPSISTLSGGNIGTSTPVRANGDRKDSSAELGNIIASSIERRDQLQHDVDENRTFSSPINNPASLRTADFFRTPVTGASSAVQASQRKNLEASNLLKALEAEAESARKQEKHQTDLEQIEKSRREKLVSLSNGRSEGTRNSSRTLGQPQRYRDSFQDDEVFTNDGGSLGNGLGHEADEKKDLIHHHSPDRDRREFQSLFNSLMSPGPSVFLNSSRSFRSSVTRAQPSPIVRG